MLWRYAGCPTATQKELPYADESEISNWALEAICWATEKKILDIEKSGGFNPGGEATRAQTAQILKNYLENQ